jgi:hypothetical protein
VCFDVKRNLCLSFSASSHNTFLFYHVVNVTKEAFVGDGATHWWSYPLVELPTGQIGYYPFTISLYVFVFAEYIVSFSGYYATKTRANYITASLRDTGILSWNIIRRHNAAVDNYPSDFDVIQVRTEKIQLHVGGERLQGSC